MSKPEIVICGDCLRILPYTDERHCDIEPCPCGGQLCGCELCTYTAIWLRQGVRNRAFLGLQPGPNLGFWCEETGIEDRASD
ncbi:hypothetical protein OOJ09_12785 [Mesorhizobium qingshengii]|uniref:Cysteine-rich CWC n=1 Tax=Mesorhizobium qingshengii TaxID=1165689 RepID=A0ABT4QU03_9HYPH|nr:hypothetical protein [Mesorhizobium qingshengii]MCZ8545062.1 hypothetical protein [Mesorhizobium qingshengii]